MKVTFVNYYYDKDIPIDKYLDKYPTIYGWCKALSDLGLEVSVYHRFSNDYSFEQDGVKYFLVKDKLRNDLKWHQTPSVFHREISKTEHEIIHVNSFDYTYQASLIKKRIPRARVVIQHHAENPRNPIKLLLLKYFSSSINGFIFSSSEIYNEWVDARKIAKGKKFSEIMEGSSNFSFNSREEMRKITGLAGDPVLLWVGRLNENKDPITVLSGFNKLLNDFPRAKLYMIYSEEKLKGKVLSLIEQKIALKESVKLLGFINYKNIDRYYNSADYFVLGSHYEGSGYSLVEAMSSGVIPIVTDIPSFRTATNEGQIGGLWKCGDAESFYHKAKEIVTRPREDELKKTFDFFSENLSFPVIAKKAKIFYENLTDN